MKNIIFGIILFSNAAVSQETELVRKIQSGGNKVKIVYTDGKISRGYAYGLVADGISIYMPNTKQINANNTGSGISGVFKTSPVSEIETISFRQKNHFKNNVIGGLLIGTIIGFIVAHIKENGIAIDINEYTTIDFTHPPVKVNYPKIMLTGAAIGTATGIISGSISKKFILKGKNERFRENRSKINQYMYTDNPVAAF